jgi:hypothetical protein
VSTARVLAEQEIVVQLVIEHRLAAHRVQRHRERLLQQSSGAIGPPTSLRISSNNSTPFGMLREGSLILFLSGELWATSALSERKRNFESRERMRAG